MTDRILIGAHDGTHVFRASRPGYDVKNSGLLPEQLSFDSRWPEIGNILMRGTFPSGATIAQTVYFGATFAQPPLVILHMSGPDNDLTQWFLIDVACYYDFNVMLYVWTDRFQVVKDDDGYVGPSPRTFRYTVMKNFYG